MLAADLDCHSASGLASHRLPYEIGKRPRSLFLSRFNVRQDHPFLIGNELIVANVKKISHRAGSPCDFQPMDSTPGAVIAAAPSLKQLLRANAACIGVEPRLSHQLSLLSLALRPVHLPDRVGLSAGWSLAEHRCALGLSDQCPGDRGSHRNLSVPRIGLGLASDLPDPLLTS